MQFEEESETRTGGNYPPLTTQTTPSHPQACASLRSTETSWALIKDKLSKPSPYLQTLLEVQEGQLAKLCLLFSEIQELDLGHCRVNNHEFVCCLHPTIALDQALGAGTLVAGELHLVQIP